MLLIYQVISYYPSKDDIVVKNYTEYISALKEYDRVVEDMRGMYEKTSVLEISHNPLTDNILNETRWLLDDYYANAYTSVRKINLELK